MQKHTFRLCIVMTVFWLLLSGYFKTNLLVLGAISVAITLYFSVKMRVLRHQGQEIYFPFIKIIPYWIWLFIEILKSNIQVAKMILNPKLSIKPSLKLISTDQETEIGRVIYANSITLTPGTVAINISNDGNIIVHALHEDNITDLEHGEMNRRVVKLEKSIVSDVAITSNSAANLNHNSQTES